MSHEISTSNGALLRRARAGMKWSILMSAAAACFAVGFIIGVIRVALGLHQEHRKFAELINVAKVELEKIGVSAGFGRPDSVVPEAVA